MKSDALQLLKDELKRGEIPIHVGIIMDGNGRWARARALGAAANRAPYRLTKYLEAVATLFHQFYHQCRVVSDDRRRSEARLALCDGARQVIKNVLWLIGVSAPEKM